MAEWCNKSLASYKKNRKRWAETKLAKYADYQLQRGGIEILSVKDPIYSPSGRKEVKEKWRSCWGNNGFDADTNKDCWQKLKPELINTISDSTGYRYLSEAKCEQYGVAYRRRAREGTKGSSRYVFCKIIDGIPVPFADEDLKIKAELEKKYLKTSTDQIYELQALAADYKRGEITSEEYSEALTEIIDCDYGWEPFQRELNKQLGCYTDFRVLIEDRAWEISPDDPFDF